MFDCSNFMVFIAHTQRDGHPSTYVPVELNLGKISSTFMG
jgi:hypothetical protein